MRRGATRLLQRATTETLGIDVAQFADFIIDKFIGPGASRFAAAEIPDVSSYDSQSKYWVANFFLNSALRASYKPPLGAYIYNYLRRTEAAFREHELARDATLSFLSSGRQSPSRYALALHHWEIFLGQAWHAFKLLEKGLSFTLYVAGSGSVEERLNMLYNQMKHVESRIAAGQMPPEATVPVWLTNSGLQSTDHSMTYAETAEILKDLAKWANVFSDPLTVKERWNAVDT